MARAENINPDILVWARESAGLSLEEAAERLGITSSERSSAVEKLEEIETGAKFPTRNQLVRISQVYRRPLITFYMKQPPRKGERGEDFRTLPAAVSNRDGANLDALLRDIRARQEMVKSLLEDEEETRPLPFVGSATISQGVEAVVKSIAAAIGYDPETQRRRSANIGADDLFRELRLRTEAIGVFVLLVGDLGSHHSAISETVFRGFAIADKIAPFIIINDQDARAARSFTLIHELAHIWLGQTGISGTADKVEPATPHGRIEQFCNDVAGEFLLPSSAFQHKPRELDAGTREAASRVITQLAQTWGVSEPMVAYRIHRLGWISANVYRELASDYAARWNALKERTKEKARETEGGPSYYTVKQFKLGNALIDVVRRTLRDNLLTHTKAAKVLGVKPSSVEPLLRNLERSRGAFTPNLRG
jgi:Zn-dependent peptidase ImmA (M78 family)